MAEIEMPNENGGNKNDGDQSTMNSNHNIGVLDSRVANLEYGFKEINVALGHLSSRLDDKFSTIGRQITDGSKTPWPLLISVVSVLFMFTSSLGYLTLAPLKEAIYRSDADIKDLRGQIVPRSELLEKNLASDKTAEFIRNTSSERYKIVLDQIDDLRKQYRDLYGAPKMIETLDARLRAMEARGGTSSTWEARAERR